MSAIIGSIFMLLIALVLPHATIATSARGIESPSVRAAASETPWLVAKRPERLKKMQIHPRPEAILELYNLAFSPKWDPLEVGLPIGIYVSVKNTAPAESMTSDFRIYLSRNGQVLQKRRPSTSGLRGGRASYTEFKITLPNKPGRYCWEVSLRQTDDGRMTLGDPRTLCALLKTKPIPGLPLKRP